MEDHYRTLGVAPNATAADLRAAYLKLARSNHPDKFTGAARDQAQTRMQGINEAWNILGVAHKRREYDTANRRTASSGPQTNHSRSSGRRGHAHFRPFDDEPIDRVDVDLDPTPISGSRSIPRWMAFVPIALVVFGVVTLGFATMVGSTAVAGLGIASLVFGLVCFLMLPLIVMSRAERDPDL